MTESERVARELLAYRDNPPVRQAGLVEGQWYESGDILWIIMAPRCEFTTYELLTRLAELMGRGTCKDVNVGGHFVCSECEALVKLHSIGRSYVDEWGKRWYATSNDHGFNYCPNCGRRIGS